MPTAYAAERSGATAPAAGADADLVNVTMTGAIALEMVEQVNQLLLHRAKGRPVQIDQAEIIEQGWAGVAHGHHVLVQALHEQASAQEALLDALERMNPA